MAETLWHDVMCRLNVHTELSSKWWSIVKEKYHEPQRHYHTMNHIDQMVDLLLKYNSFIQHFDAVYLAIVFHDIIYDPVCNDNEEKSAALFWEFSQQADLNEDMVNSVSNWILLTKTHSTDVHTCSNDDVAQDISDLHYFIDFDLSVLGWPPQEYAEYSKQIRQEYIHVPQEIYQIKRPEVLQSLMSGPHLYATQIFRDKYEAQARFNIEKEICYWKQSESKLKGSIFCL